MQTYAEYPKQSKKMLHKSDSHGDYTYIELLPTNNNATTEEELKQFFYNYGELLAFGEFFCITDGHYENIVVNMPQVHWIDLETALHVLPNFSVLHTTLIANTNKWNYDKGILGLI
ncbi:DUF4135 domain-containing protein, partial [Arthrospira platensis SPKY1]|nr:DUF4135 domain-containing protein [Arthrospira platensis SPKY1]